MNDLLHVSGCADCPLSRRPISDTTAVFRCTHPQSNGDSSFVLGGAVLSPARCPLAVADLCVRLRSDTQQKGLDR